MQEVLHTAIIDTLKKLGLPEVEFTVEHPSDLAHGDYACNVALVVAKEAGKAPREVAGELSAALNGQIEYIEKIEVAGPGFINFHLSRDFFTKEIERALKAGEQWGKNNKLSEEEILLEYTSPNLFKPLHVGNLVGNIIGESLSRIFEFSGATVRRLNYPSDIGLTVAKGVWGLKQSGGDGKDIAALGQAYIAGNAAYEEGGSAKEEIEAVNRALYAGSEDELNRLREAGIATSRASLNAICAKLGTTFDAEIFESEAGPVGTKIVKENIGKVFEESEGAVVYRGEKVGLHTRVFLNSQGLPTYEAKDLGNFTLKQEKFPHWTQSIIVTGSEQAEYFKVIFAAIKEVFQFATDKLLIHIPTGFLTLTTGKMSSRKGNVLTGESLLQEVEAEAKARATEGRAEDATLLSEAIAVAALKYQILKQTVGSNMVFDKEKALSFEGDSGPYLQYTHARIGSVLEKAAVNGITVSSNKSSLAAYELERLLYRFPEVVESAAAESEPQKVLAYLIALAGSFNTFYSNERIADSSDEFAPYKAALSAAVKQTLKNGLWLLGIKAPERM